MLSALHGCAAFKVGQSCFMNLGAACVSAVWSRRMPLAHGCTVLGLPDGLDVCDPPGSAVSGTGSV